MSPLGHVSKRANIPPVTNTDTSLCYCIPVYLYTYLPLVTSSRVLSTTLKYLICDYSGILSYYLHPFSLHPSLPSSPPPPSPPPTPPKNFSPPPPPFPQPLQSMRMMTSRKESSCSCLGGQLRTFRIPAEESSGQTSIFFSVETREPASLSYCRCMGSLPTE